MDNPRDLQHNYYQRTADTYDDRHVADAWGEQEFALYFLSSLIEYFNIQSVLDIGSGTGRAVHFIMKRHPDVRIIGIEPVRELRDQGFKKGIPTDMLIEGDGYNLEYPDKTFDIVCEFGMLHHVAKPERIINEMIRVSRVGFFISDSNNFGAGSFLAKQIKRIINTFGFWPAFNYLRTKGKMYQISEGDGLYYSYSVFNNFRQIEKNCKSIHILNTTGGKINPYTSASHVALLGLKHQ